MSIHSFDTTINVYDKDYDVGVTYEVVPDSSHGDDGFHLLAVEYYTPCNEDTKRLIDNKIWDDIAYLHWNNH